MHEKHPKRTKKDYKGLQNGLGSSLASPHFGRFQWRFQWRQRCPACGSLGGGVIACNPFPACPHPAPRPAIALPSPSPSPVMPPDLWMPPDLGPAGAGHALPVPVIGSRAVRAGHALTPAGAGASRWHRRHDTAGERCPPTRERCPACGSLGHASGAMFHAAIFPPFQGKRGFDFRPGRRVNAIPPRRDRIR